MGKVNYTQRLLVIHFILLAGLLMMHPAISFGADGVCARVKIEIKQELTLERQAFEAHMRINNGLSHIILENVNVAVAFADKEGNPVPASSDPANTDAHFFIRLDSMQNIENVSGSGTVEPTASADIHWLIIPAPGSSNGLEQGTLYYVGATLSYTIGGEEKVTEVTPDYIFVKPMPQIALDYFLPTDVYGDDAFTPEIEPAVPFALGVRIKNNGHGVARNLKIESAQPKIIENEQGLLIGFAIEGSEVNGRPVDDSLLADFGDIAPHAAGVARWIMTCSLSGQFVKFTAELSHSDELGGELTSLIEAANTHFLVHEVRVDLAGRDLIRDFLAKDGAVYRVYESDSTDTVVTDQSATATLQVNGNAGILAAPATAGFMVVRLPDSFAGQKSIKEAIRSDGKVIKAENIWLSKTRDEDNNWQYYVNLFDVNTTDRYTLKFIEASDIAQAPELFFIPNRTVAEDEQVLFEVEATDPNGTFPALSAAPLPAGAVFHDQGDGRAKFDWTPAEGQAGIYEITYTAADGVLSASRRAKLIVQAFVDTDGDGMDDTWEEQYFENLSRDGTGDYDGDGISDLDEFLNETDPAASNAPTIPVIFAPTDGAEVSVFQPELKVVNSTDPDGDAIAYRFEIYADEQMNPPAVSSTDQPQTAGQTAWTVSQLLQENSWYHWRVRAGDGKGFSQWAYGRFFVNTANDLPASFQISSPPDTTEVDTIAPTLAVTNSTDADEDSLNYTFEVYADQQMTTLVASAAGIAEGSEGTTAWVVPTVLTENTWYFWNSIVTDEHGAQTQSPMGSFFVNTNNDAPEAPVMSSPPLGVEVDVQQLDLVVINATDADWDVLSYIFELDQVNTFDSAGYQGSGEVFEGSDTTSWSVMNLADNTRHYWRVQATDGAASSPWVQGEFFVNTANDTPTTPTLKNPGASAWVDTLEPMLQLNASTDVDEDQIIYYFEIYSNLAMTYPPVFAGHSETAEWVAPSELSDNTWYYWRAQAGDEHGAFSAWMETASFFTDENGFDDPPTIVLQEPSQNIVTEVESVLISWQDTDPETNAEIALYFDTDGFGEDGTLIDDGIYENSDGAFDTYAWDINTMAEGTYYIYGIITDGHSDAVSYAPATVTIARPPTVTCDVPQPGVAVQDVVTFEATASDDSGIEQVYFYLREDDGAQGTAFGYEDLLAAFDGTNWNHDVDTTDIPDGYYVIAARAVDIHGNESWSEPVPFSIRNWAVVELLPASENNRAGRTMPVKFSLRIAEAVDPEQPFVYSEELEINIINSAETVLQTSRHGVSSTNYRIDAGGEMYITNFKTPKTPDNYTVEVWRIRNGFLLDTFTFETTKK